MCSLIEDVVVEATKCKGCTNCIKHCPVQAIRVKNGKAKIIKSKCIHCGTCIQTCSFNAFTGILHGIEDMFRYSYRIAIIDPVLYGQFNDEITPPEIIDGIKKYGFDEVVDLSLGTKAITEYTKKYVAAKEKLPIISSSCPAVIRLIQLRFHELTKHILPIKSPAEITAYMARKKAREALELRNEEIGVYYFSPCTAQLYNTNLSADTRTQYINGTLSIKSAFLMLSKELKSCEGVDSFCPSGKGLNWGRVEGQSKALGIREYLAIDGIENVMEILEKIQDQKIKDVAFLECQACINGCVGGNLTIENSFVARNRIRELAGKYHTCTMNNIGMDTEKMLITKKIRPLYGNKLDSDLFKAMEKLNKIEMINKTLPQKDCGACGSPSCRALAKDIVLGYAKQEDCMVNIKKTSFNSIVEEIAIEDYI
ncbi:[Fe-Fe] hydrogenase large subunit C-terminal domain-containing protein [Natronincola peptidivorans]|uniref:[Fe-Fe] hydrogenase large subunit C-terminal domain-containing protein n=1 Tax=Natronincola peptidivorans TaxID=426128 RepID=UPI00147BC92A|nr:[Fe-Fe] hydrogenase large subunit C-terminal domain-containing protein [Natronincola peptidivorans]